MFHQTFPQEISFLLNLKVIIFHNQKISTILKIFRGQCPRVRAFFHVWWEGENIHINAVWFTSYFLYKRKTQTRYMIRECSHKISCVGFKFGQNGLMDIKNSLCLSKDQTTATYKHFFKAKERLNVSLFWLILLELG